MRKVSRREFLAIAAKTAIGMAVFSLVPLRLLKKSAASAKDIVAKKFSIPLKPFRRDDLFKKHTLS